MKYLKDIRIQTAATLVTDSQELETLVADLAAEDQENITGALVYVDVNTADVEIWVTEYRAPWDLYAMYTPIATYLGACDCGMTDADGYCPCDAICDAWVLGIN